MENRNQLLCCPPPPAREEMLLNCLLAQGEANARLVKVKAEATRAGQTPLSISASKGDGNPHRARGRRGGSTAKLGSAGEVMLKPSSSGLLCRCLGAVTKEPS